MTSRKTIAGQLDQAEAQIKPPEGPVLILVDTYADGEPPDARLLYTGFQVIDTAAGTSDYVTFERPLDESECNRQIRQYREKHNLE